MREDAYSEIVDVMRGAVKPPIPVSPIHLRLGIVLCPSPLKVDVSGTIQEADRFYISHRLVKEHWELLRLDCIQVSQEFRFSSSCPHLVPHGSHEDDPASSFGTLYTPHCVATQAEPVLKVGDEVLLLTEDDQWFYLIDKVVKSDEWDLSHCTARDGGGGAPAAAAVPGGGLGLRPGRPPLLRGETSEGGGGGGGEGVDVEDADDRPVPS